MSEKFERPHPALTEDQRIHLEINGYVVIENTLSTAEVTRLCDKIYEIEQVFRDTGTLPNNAKTFFGRRREFFRIDNLPHVDQAFYDYVTHPRLVGMAEEAIGGEARLEQSDAHIRRPPEDKNAQRLGFHRGSTHHLAMTANGLYHFPFVKTLTNLTDLGPDDGGTVVIAGSHKLSDALIPSVVNAAFRDPRLIHQVIAPAGSTLLFFESLIHGSGIIRSDNDRVLIIGGYTPTMFQPWTGYDVEPSLLAEAPSEHLPLLTGNKRWSWVPRFGSLKPPPEVLGHFPE